MATVDSNFLDGFSVPARPVDPAPQNGREAEADGRASRRAVSPGGEEPEPAVRLHRIREVRLQQGVSLRSAARHTGRDVRTLRKQERPDSDLMLSDLIRWQQALDVPLAELLEEGEAPLSRPVLERARLLRLMKTAAAIHQRAESESIQRMAQMLMEQLIEVMPELKDVSPWHQYGQRRGLDEMGRIFESQISEDQLGWE
ncbi:MAG: helix-turn-helix transcriptional regulator [Planctomycetales bacterium]|nr:helix-turn-helix transcriptional regulator [Planctomycetales bacterium]